MQNAVIGIAVSPIIAALMGTAAFAADMPVKAPPPPPAAAWSWTGFYIGGNVGYGIAVDPTAQSLSGVTGSGTWASFNQVPRGMLGGGQLGYNWQFAPHWVLGAEADWQWSSQRNSTCDFVCAPVSNGPAIPLTQIQKLQDVGTARARFGYAQDNWLWYATGGFAWGSVEQSYGISELGIGNSVTDRHDLTGWTAGGGVEAALGGGWSAKLEYLYIELGSVSDSFANPFVLGTFTTQSSVHDNVIRVGLNYNFGGGGSAGPADPGGALAYKAPPYKAPPAAATANWSGFYLGGNFGYGVAVDPTTETLSEPAALGFSGVVTSMTAAPNGVIGGGQVGYNWQFDPHWVLGAEADWQGSAQHETTCTWFCTFTGGGEPVTLDQRLKDFGTARARFGYAQGHSLWYATGGFAWGTVGQTVTFSDLPIVGLTSVSDNHDLTGWTVGGGVETALWGGWSVKLEYLHIDLGSVSDSVVLVPFLTSSVTSQSDIRDNVVRVGLNYKLGAL